MRLRRRDFIAGAGSLALLSGCKPGFELAAGTDFDSILARLHTTDSMIGTDFTNHGSMVAEALVTLDHEKQIVPLLNEYSRTFNPLPGGEPIPVGERPAAIGHGELRGAWIATFVAEAQTTEPSVLLQREWPNLTAGFVADLFHGPLRVGHALRSLSRADTTDRRNELGHALGHWLAWDVTLPGRPGANPTPGLDLVQALNAVPVVPKAERAKSNDIQPMMEVLTGRADFVAAIEAVDFTVWPLEVSLTELVAAAARWFTKQGDIWSLHGVTGTSVTRLLLPSLTSAQQQEALRCAFHGLAGLYAVTAAEAGIPEVVSPGTSTLEAQVARAGTTMDAHVVKLVEACRRESAIDPRPEFLTAAAKWKP